MPATDLILDPATLDLNTIIADAEAIRRCNPQRFEMEQLSAIVHDDVEAGIVVGYKDVTDKEFWVRGHMPSLPLMPGVIMCEAAAQVCSYHIMANELMQAEMIGFGGLDDVKFRGPVAPGSRMIVVAQRMQLRPKAMVRCRFQCFVKDRMVCEGQLRGIPIPVEALRAVQ